MEFLIFIGITGHGCGAVKWKDIEKRFNRLALIRNSHEPVVKWSDFGFCIGVIETWMGKLRRWILSRTLMFMVIRSNIATTDVATGIVMVILMAMAFSLAAKWPSRRSPSLPSLVQRVTGYNTFCYSHHLFILVYALLVIHSMFLFLTDNTIEKTASFYPGKVLYLTLQKPESLSYRSGMYIFIQCPQISSVEWHPFSLTSGPVDDFQRVHIRTLGEWSYQIYSLYQEATSYGVREHPKIYIDGPYGAASQDHIKYDIVLLIGLGIGATPFISILKDIVNFIQNACCNNVRSLSLQSFLYV
ncbi:respiratory burst oxidase homolog protein D-like [Ziziphus jujuba]|uniref:Respiratory burst oxidase homolog protein D-like n=1 Tax=Ziziphus jujuba TaxID=326968 RepID=A0ABM4A3J0_ZIZJJ|nr:respiratory burst oxidase homolog protein D-like [Ziziphus jujuba]